MIQSDAFDPVEFKEEIRGEWRSAAAGWRKWYDVLEAEESGQRISGKLIQLAGIGPGASVLDVGGGYGEPSLTAAHAVGPKGRIVCTDISGEMLAFGRERATEAGLHNVEFLECDAEKLDFEDESFDAVVSRATLMFLTDVPGTLGYFHSFLKRSGRFAASVWGPPPKVQFSAAVPIILDELKLPPPMPGRPGLFALADRDRLATLVAGAGFCNIETGTVCAVFATETPEQFTEFIRDVAPPVANLVKAQPPDVQKRIWGKVTEVWRQFLDADGRVRTENEAIWVAGTK